MVYRRALSGGRRDRLQTPVRSGAGAFTAPCGPAVLASMPDERTSTATTATAEPSTRLRITKLLSRSAFQISTQVMTPAYRSKSLRGLSEQPLLICIIFAALACQLFTCRKPDLFESQDMRAVFREIACHRDLIPRLERILGPADPGKAQGADRFHCVLLDLARRVVHFNKN